MTDKAPTAADAIKRLEEKDAQPNNESARTNELLAARAGTGKDDDPVAASIKANDPSLSRSAYTSEKTGFNEDITPPEDTPIPTKGSKGQTSTVNR